MKDPGPHLCSSRGKLYAFRDPVPPFTGSAMPAKKKGLYDNINAKRKAGKKMRKKGAKGAPSDADFKAAAKTAKKKTSKKKTSKKKKMA